MDIISINYKNAPIDIRNKISFSDEESTQFCRKAMQVCTECMILSTCNRTEIYYVGNSDSTFNIEKLISSENDIQHDKLIEYYRIYSNNSAIKHIYRVASGIDSMVLGEDEILHQLKKSFLLAQSNNTTKYELNTIIKGSISCAKKIKTDTLLSKKAVSIGTLTANEVLHLNKDTKTVLIIGITGKMGSIIMKNLLDSNVTIIGTIRNHNKMFEYTSTYENVHFIDYTDRYKYINSADVIISATTSPHYTVTKNNLQPILDTSKEHLFIDLSVPQDIDKSIEELSNVTLKNIDYFQELSKQNNLAKYKEVEKAELIIEQEIDTLLKELSFHELLPYMDKLLEYDKNFGLEHLIFKIKSKSDSQTFKNMVQYIKELLS